MKRPGTPALCLLFLLLAVSLLAFAQEGYASWYGGKFQGRRTASGEPFDTNAFTAAHKSLPFGTLVKVTNLENGQTTVVRINDRGPFVPGRIIDLSRAAAAAIGMAGKGVVRVRIEKLAPDSPEAQAAAASAPRVAYSIQIGAFRNRDYAQRIVGELAERGFQALLERSGQGIYRVVLKDIEEADLEATRRELREQGWEEHLVRRQP